MENKMKNGTQIKWHRPRHPRVDSVRPIDSLIRSSLKDGSGSISNSHCGHYRLVRVADYDNCGRACTKYDVLHRGDLYSDFDGRGITHLATVTRLSMAKDICLAHANN